MRVFFAGQINGTGYEEAAGQGILADSLILF